KERIKESRVRGTRLLAETLTRLDHKPAVLVSASATGFYGERGDYVCDESASSGSGFLTDVCVAWEAATEAALKAGIRVVNVRSGVVLSRAGGALHKMLLPFRLGGGGVVGSGRQIWSWIAIDDLVRIFERALVDESLRGPVNAVAPQAVTNREFTKTLGRVLRRPTLIPMPAWLARLVLGEMADHLLLASTHVVPQRLQDLGFSFTYPDLEAALRHELTDVR
ncbi:MAG: TIGR01777 family oxidoreductase, partial [Pirellulaceae bacterium]